VEVWTEVNLFPAREPSESLLTGLIGDLVHETFRGELETWFFFREPELRLRLRWSDPARVEALRSTLGQALDDAVGHGALVEWFEGAHGRRGETYEGEAEMYGTELWSLVQKDWMNGSELAVRIAELEEAGELSRPRPFHWERHVHLFTNQLFGSWDSEIELCLAQALGYLRHSTAAGGTPSEETARLIADLRAALHSD
jgi:Lantibiotic biosynthesis dehydratase C-term